MNRHAEWQAEAEPELRRICREQAGRIRVPEDLLREYELAAWQARAVPGKPVLVKGRG